jgi:hypothetical protein
VREFVNPPTMKKIIFVLSLSLSWASTFAHAEFGFYEQCEDDHQCHQFDIHTDQDHGIVAATECGANYSGYAANDTCHIYTACGQDLGVAEEASCQTAN